MKILQVLTMEVQQHTSMDMLQQEIQFQHIQKYYQHPDEEYKLYTDYPNIFPHFRNSISYNSVLYNLPKEHQDFYEKHPEVLQNETSIGHDATPSESYADLMTFREALNRFGVYDSRKANNPFTREHLNKWKKLNKHLRLFDNFTDDQIIEMMQLKIILNKIIRVYMLKKVIN